jgi:uncharacterized protein (DUF362 family)
MGDSILEVNRYAVLLSYTKASSRVKMARPDSSFTSKRGLPIVTVPDCFSASKQTPKHHFKEPALKNSFNPYSLQPSPPVWSRRRFLHRGLVCFAAAATGLWRPRLGEANGPPDLAIARGQPGPAVRAAVASLGGMTVFVRPGDKVVIKPNMSFGNNVEQATNTHPEVVRELVALCREAGAGRIQVLDHPLRPPELCIEGVRQACSVFEEEMVHGLTSPRFFKSTGIAQGVQMRQTDIMQEVLEADVLISAPKAKSHGSTGVSLSLKGMMGLIWDRGIMHYKYDLNESIVDLATVLRPRLVVVDATRALTTNGPGGPGKVLKLDTIIAAADPVAADAQTVSLVPWYGQKIAPRQVAHIRRAHERGIGRMDIENLKIKRVDAA